MNVHIARDTRVAAVTMSIAKLIDKTASRLQVMLAVIALPGVVLLGAGFATGAMAFAGLGMAFLIGCAVAIWRVRAQRAQLHELLKNPSRVVQIVPIVQRVQGVITNYPIVLVTDDGRSFRLATWAKSVEEAVSPFLAHFPQASGPGGDSLFAPDDGFGARLKLLGLMLGALVLGGLSALLFVTPSVNAQMAHFDRAYALQVAKNEALLAAVEAVSTAEVEGSWSTCQLDSLGDGVDVRLGGTRARSGFLLPQNELKLEEASELVVYRADRWDVTLNALMGTRSYHSDKVAEDGLAVVGVRRDDPLSLRLVQLPGGKVLCEGTAPIGPVEKGDSYLENKALAAAVMRPFCALMRCDGLGPAPQTMTAKPVVEKPTESKRAPVGGKALTPDTIRSTVGASSARTRGCYEKALVKQRTLQGTLTVAFSIGKDGKVMSAAGTGFPDKAVSDCVVKVFQGLRFPPPADGKLTPVRYPIVFRPAG